MRIQEKYPLVTVLGLAALLALGVGLGKAAAKSDAAIEFTDVEKQTQEFIQYNKTITLTPEQEAIKYEALADLPAPCCSDRSAYTCCCSCNMAQSWWGLSKHVIANGGYDAKQVREVVERWFAFINPDGFSGDSCYKGGCARSFENNGCGGMDDKNVVF